jgi:hypothetical protein
MELKGKECAGVDYFELAQDRVKSGSEMNTIMNLWVP